MQIPSAPPWAEIRKPLRDVRWLIERHQGDPICLTPQDLIDAGIVEKYGEYSHNLAAAVLGELVGRGVLERLADDAAQPALAGDAPQAARP